MGSGTKKVENHCPMQICCFKKTFNLICMYKHCFLPLLQTGKRGSCRRDIVRDTEIFGRDTPDKTYARDVYA